MEQFWAMAIQNEPNHDWLSGYRYFNLVGMSPEEQRDFLVKDLSHLFAEKHPHVKLVINDDNRHFLPFYAGTVS